MAAQFTRRRFIRTASGAGAGLSLARPLYAQTSVARADVAGMERERILADVKDALKRPVTTITSIASPKHDADPHDFYSELPPDPTWSNPGLSQNAFRAHATALRRFSNTVATLTAAYVVTHEDSYAMQAGKHLAAWFVQPATRMNPQLAMAGFVPSGKVSVGVPAGMVDAAPLAEVARAMSFLVDTEALSAPDLETAHQWLATFLDWMNTAREPAIAREAKDRSASTWLLVAAAISRSLRDSAMLDTCTHRFRKPTLRNQINLDGVFMHEITTAYPFRNTLLNFELLTGACQLLNTPFENLWQYELEEGVGIRSVLAFLFPMLKDRAKWSYVADPQHFRDLPGRRAGLLFAGRAFDRPEYVELWRSTPAPDMEALPEPIAASFPIHEPMLWTARAAHGL